MQAFVVGADANGTDGPKNTNTCGVFATIVWDYSKQPVYGSLVLTYWLS